MDETGHSTAAIVNLLFVSIFPPILMTFELRYRNEKEREKEAK